MHNTTNFDIPMVFHDQFSKDWVINKALVMIDSFMMGVVASRTLAEPPHENELKSLLSVMYIVPINAKGAWSWEEGANHIALYIQGEWSWIRPKKFMCLWVADESNKVIFTGEDWIVNDSLSHNSLY